MSDNVLQDFFNDQSEEEQKARQASVDQASSEGMSVPLKVSGTFLMEVGTYAFPDKKTKEMRTSPELKISETKGSLMLLVSLRVIDSAPGVPKGSSILTNIVLSPAKGANKETMDNTMKLMKPRIVALTGEENISITSDWFDEWLLPKFEVEKNGKYKMIKDHKMKKQVMVVIEDDVYNDKPTLAVKSIIRAQPGDKSVPNTIVKEDEAPKQEMKPPSDSEFSNSDIDKAVDQGSTEQPQPEKSQPQSTPESSSIPDDF